MGGFVFNRVCQMTLLLLLMSLLSYVLIGLMPGDPIDIMVAANPEASAEDVARLKKIYGLDKPLIERYFSWISNVLQGDIGYSRLYNQPVMDILKPRMMSTLLLMGGSLFLTILIAIPVGIWASYKPYSFTDNVINFMCFAGISVPPFWLSLMMITLFSVTLGWLPASAMSLNDDVSFWEQLKYMILPILALTLGSVGGYTRHMRSAMIEALQADHIRTARAKGCSEYRVIFHHALQFALVPLVTLLALDFGMLFGGALITETLFSWPGMGKMIFDTIIGNDYNLALMGLLCVTFMVLVASFIVDGVYFILNPSLRT